MQRITTESGAAYLLDLEQRRVKRENPGHVKRGDGEWQPLLDARPFPPEVGARLVIAMESLSRYGADDQGTENGGPTTRVTTPVATIEGVVQ